MIMTCSVIQESSSNQNSSAKPYEGVRKKGSKWVAEIKEPFTKRRRLWLGTYATAEEASKVYESKKVELGNKVVAAEEKKRKRNKAAIDDYRDDKKILISDQRNVSQEIDESPRAKPVYNEGSGTANDPSPSSVGFDNGDGLKVDNSPVVEGDKCSEDSNILARFGPLIIDRHGFILGEFSWIDDLSIKL